MDLEEIKKKKKLFAQMSLYFFTTIFQSTFFFFKYKEIRVTKNHTNDVEVSKTYIRYDTLPRLKMVIE